MSEKNPAYPTMDVNCTSGMSKRFYAACAAMQGILSGNSLNVLNSDEAVIKASYLLADELLKQESE